MPHAVLCNKYARVILDATKPSMQLKALVKLHVLLATAPGKEGAEYVCCVTCAPALEPVQPVAPAVPGPAVRALLQDGPLCHLAQHLLLPPRPCCLAQQQEWSRTPAVAAAVPATASAAKMRCPPGPLPSRRCLAGDSAAGRAQQQSTCILRHTTSRLVCTACIMCAEWAAGRHLAKAAPVVAQQRQFASCPEPHCVQRCSTSGVSPHRLAGSALGAAGRGGSCCGCSVIDMTSCGSEPALT
jgi:hypothetical protein